MPPRVILQGPPDMEANNQLFKSVQMFKSFSHSWKLASDATSGSFEPKCDKHNLNKTESLLSK